MELNCTNCQDNIDAALANVQTDLIQCPNCKTIHQLSQLMEGQSSYTKPVRSGYSSRYEVFSGDEPLPPVPAGSDIQVFPTYSSVEFSIPPGGFGAMDAFLTFFTLFWIGFVAVWTFFASQAFFVMALFSLPFWWVGMQLAQNLIRRLFEHQTIILDAQMLKIVRKGVFVNNTEELTVNQIDTIDFLPANLKRGFRNIGMGNNQRKMMTNGKTQMVLPTIRVGVKDYSFFENAKEAEQEWAIKILADMVRRLK